MRMTALSGFRELLYAALIIFSAVSLATLEFLKNAVPTTDALEFPKTTVVYLVVLVQVLPALVLLGADRLIAARYGAGRRLRVFRSVLFVVAVILIARQLQLYWGPAEDFTDSVSSSLVWLVLVDLIFLAAVVGLAIWLFRGLAMFFAYMSPVAIVMTVLIPFQVPTGGGLPGTFAQEVETATHSESQPAVFILVFDELGYDVLSKEGKVDAESFPNIAALAGDGVWFTNATTNNFRSVVTLSNIIDAANSLAQYFDIRLYTQFLRVEQRYVDDCGKVMTCRGVGYLTANNQLRLAGNLVLRAFYEATPKSVDTAIDRPMGWLLDRLGWAYPSVDPALFHMFTKRQFSVFLDDIEGQKSQGRIHVLHLLIPHNPFAFNGEGMALSTVSPGAPSPTSPMGSPSVERYRQQTMFVDVLVGRFISKLKSEGIYDESVIILTGDHGPRAHFPSSLSPPDEFLPHVPLVILAPGLNSRASDVDYQHIDFGPTLTDILGLPLPKDAEGVSAFSEERPQRDKVIRVDHDVFVYSEEYDSWYFSHEE